MTEAKSELWRPIGGYDGWYEVSDLGRVRSWRHRGRNRARAVTPRLISMVPNQRGGYLQVVLTPPVGRLRGEHVHLLVLRTFVGPCPDGMEARHMNGIPLDCSLANLQWGTRAANAADKFRHGTHTSGIRNGGAKFNDMSIVRAIRSRLASGELGTILAAEFNVSNATISRIKHNARYKD